MYDKATGKIHTIVSSADEGEALDTLSERCVDVGPWMICCDANRQDSQFRSYVWVWKKMNPEYRAVLRDQRALAIAI